MSELKGVLPRGTEVTINGFKVRFNENLHFTALGVSNYDQAAEQSAIGQFPADWSHEEKVEREIEGETVEVTVLVQYGPQGNRIETVVCQNPVEEGSVAVALFAGSTTDTVVIDELPQIVVFTEPVEEIETHPVTIHNLENAPAEEVVEEVVEVPKAKAKTTKTTKAK